MKDVTDAKGLRHLKTATTRRIRTKPPQRGTAHLDMYLLSKEKQRLQQELAHLDDRRARILNHLAEIQGTIAKLQQEAQAEDVSVEISGDPASGDGRPATPKHSGRQWKKMPLEY